MFLFYKESVTNLIFNSLSEKSTLTFQDWEECEGSKRNATLKNKIKNIINGKMGEIMYRKLNNKLIMFITY